MFVNNDCSKLILDMFELNYTPLIHTLLPDINLLPHVSSHKLRLSSCLMHLRQMPNYMVCIYFAHFKPTFAQLSPFFINTFPLLTTFDNFSPFSKFVSSLL